MCFDDIRERELRSVSFIMLENQTTSIASAGADKAEVEMILMHRNASSTLVLPVTIPLPMVADPGTGLPTAAFPPVTDVECRRYAKILLASPSYVAENVYEHEAMEMERLLQSDTDLDGLERKYLEMARDTSLGRMHAVGSGVPSGANPGAIAIPGLPARSSSTVASSPSSLGSPPQIGTFLSAPGGDRNFHFYQAADGSHVYLHPLDIRILKQEFGDYSVFPAKITARVQEFEEGSVNSDLRKRFRYLGHLPLGCDVTFAEIVLDGFVSEETLSRCVGVENTLRCILLTAMVPTQFQKGTCSPRRPPGA